MKKMILCTVLAFTGILIGFENVAKADTCPEDQRNTCSTVSINLSQAKWKNEAYLSYTPCGGSSMSTDNKILEGSSFCAKKDTPVGVTYNKVRQLSPIGLTVDKDLTFTCTGEYSNELLPEKSASCTVD